MTGWFWCSTVTTARRSPAARSAWGRLQDAGVFEVTYWQGRRAGAGGSGDNSGYPAINDNMQFSGR